LMMLKDDIKVLLNDKVSLEVIIMFDYIFFTVSALAIQCHQTANKSA
jgi:hypothetical protein